MSRSNCHGFVWVGMYGGHDFSKLPGSIHCHPLADVPVSTYKNVLLLLLLLEYAGMKIIT